MRCVPGALGIDRRGQPGGRAAVEVGRARGPVQRPADEPSPRAAEAQECRAELGVLVGDRQPQLAPGSAPGRRGPGRTQARRAAHEPAAITRLRGERGVAARRGRSARRGCRARRSARASSTTIWSASRTVESRWAMAIVVRSCGQAVQRLLHGALGLVVQRAGGLVEHQHRRVAQDRPGDGDALLLAAGEAVAALADDGVVAVGQRRDEVVDLRGARAASSSSSSVASGLAKRRFSADRGVEEVGLLGDQPDGLRQRGEAEVAHVDAVDRHAAGVGVVEPRDEVAQRRLAASRSPPRSPCVVPGGTSRSTPSMRRRRRPRRSRSVTSLEARPRRGPSRAQRRPASSRSAMSTGEVEVLEDARGTAPASSARRRRRDSSDWIGKNSRVCSVREGDERADRDRLDPGQRLPGEPVDERRHDREAHLHRWPSASGRPSASGPRGRRARADSRVKRSASSSPRPIVLPSRMPLTDSDSSTSALMSASRPWRAAVMRLRSCADAARQPDEERQQRQARTRPGASPARTSPRSWPARS